MKFFLKKIICGWRWYKNFRKKGLRSMLHGEEVEVDKENLETLAPLE
jgi:hypothetical protein